MLMQALVFLPLTLMGVNVFGVWRWQRVLARLPRVGSIPNSSLAPKQSRDLRDDQTTRNRIRKIVRILRVAARNGLHHPNCLQQSLVLWWLLRRNGIDSEIRFGARKEDGRLEAHAWVECLGFALNENHDVGLHYSPFEAA